MSTFDAVVACATITEETMSVGKNSSMQNFKQSVTSSQTNFTCYEKIQGGNTTFRFENVYRPNLTT